MTSSPALPAFRCQLTVTEGATEADPPPPSPPLFPHSTSAKGKLGSTMSFSSITPNGVDYSFLAVTGSEYSLGCLQRSPHAYRSCQACCYHTTAWAVKTGGLDVDLYTKYQPRVAARAHTVSVIMRLHRNARQHGLKPTSNTRISVPCQAEDKSCGAV